MMDKNITNPELSYKLKQIGFDEGSNAYYDAYNGGYHLNYSEKPKSFIQKLRYLFRREQIEVFHQDYVDYITDDCGCLAPLKSDVFRWFREKYNIYHTIPSYHCLSDNKPFGLFFDVLEPDKNWWYVEYVGDYSFDSYEEAEDKAIEVAIDYVKKNYGL